MCWSLPRSQIDCRYDTCTPGDLTPTLQLAFANCFKTVDVHNRAYERALCHAAQSGDYAAAWEAAIINRVDLNCLVDFAWPSFLSGMHTLGALLLQPCMQPDGHVSSIVQAVIKCYGHSCPSALSAITVRDACTPPDSLRAAARTWWLACRRRSVVHTCSGKLLRGCGRQRFGHC